MRRASILMTAIPAAMLVAIPATATLAAPAFPASPRVAALQVSADPFTNPAAWHATEVEPDTVAAGHAIMSVFQVGRWPNGCADDTGWAFSSDGGMSWQHGLLPGLTKRTSPPGPFDRASDPVVAYDAAAGTWIAASLDCFGTSPRPGTWAVSPAISVNFSADGTHWTKTRIVARETNGKELDKEWITCDNTPKSPFFGNCYLEWDLVGTNLVVMSTSRDGGLTWSKPVPNASRLKGIGGEPVVQPDGTVVVPIVGFSGKTDSLVDFRSTDGGRTWGPTVRVAGLFEHEFAANPRAPIYPSVDLDHAGRIYVTWPDCRFRPSCASDDMVLTSSADGLRWTPVVRVPTGPVSGTADDLGGGIGVDATTAGDQARMAIFYYFYSNGQCTVGACLLYEAYVSSTDGGAHWSAPEVLAGPTRPRQLAYSDGFMTGDYQGVAIDPGGRALSAFAVGAVAGAQQLNEAMFEPSGGAPVTGGANPASPAGARRLSPERLSRLFRQGTAGHLS